MRATRVGLTGNIGAGKSSVARLLAARGAAVIDADALAREASGDPSVLAEISRALGSELVAHGRLDRAKTAERIFGDAAARRVLNGIIHPWVRRESTRRALVLERQGAPLIVFDIPLLYESGLADQFDAVVVVDAPLEVRLARLRARSHLSEAEARARDAAQLPLAEKVVRADFVIDNGGSEDDLAAQVDALWPKLLCLP